MDVITAALITGAGTVEFLPFDDTPPQPGTVTVDISLCGVCGTDLASFRSGHLHSPAVCGHEWVGTVAEVGAGVVDPAPGDRVVVAVPPPCGACPECRADLAEHCRQASLAARGRDALAPPHGAFARRITVAASRVVRVHPALHDVAAALVEPAAVAFHGVRRTGQRPGDTVVVQGAGPIGLLTAQFSRAAGAGRVVVVEPDERRRALAAELGADLTVAPDGAADLVLDVTGGVGADVTMECAGVPHLLQTAVDLTRAGGTVGLISFLSEPATIQGGRWLAKEIRVIASTAYTHGDFARAMGLIADGRVRVAPLHSRTVALAGLPEALRDLAAGGDDVKVLVDPRQ